jgi:hypothetical protein
MSPTTVLMHGKKILLNSLLIAADILQKELLLLIARSSDNDLSISPFHSRNFA